MKKALLIMSLIFFGILSSYAQLTANAGNDTIMCVGTDTIHLGAMATVSGGTPPYTYTWETSYTIGLSTFHASTFLSDTTISNPEIKNPLGNSNSLTFSLTVKDSLGNTDTDTVVVRFSNFTIFLGDNFAYITLGDSVQLSPVVSGGAAPLSHEWTPNYKLSNFMVSQPWASPDSTTFYCCHTTDAEGCHTSCGDTFEVYVTPANAIESDIITDFKLYPNPATDKLVIEFENKKSKSLMLEIYNSVGKLTWVENLNLYEKTTINTSHTPPGIYFITLKSEGRILVSKKWIKAK